MTEEFNPTITKIDGVNYSRTTIPTADGPKELEGITVRAMRAALEKADPDAIVAYIAEQNGGLLIGCIAGVAMNAPKESNVVFLFGPEVVRGIKAAGLME